MNIGRVKITRQLVESVQGIFSEMNPIHIEEKEYGMLLYTCYSDHFEEVEEGEVIPLYDCTIIQADDSESKNLIFQFEKES